MTACKIIRESTANNLCSNDVSYVRAMVVLGLDGPLMWVEVGAGSAEGSDEAVMLALVEMAVAHCDKYRTVAPEPSAPMPVER